MWKSIVLLILVADHNRTYVGACSYFDAFRGEEITKAEYMRHVDRNDTFWCVTEVKLPCDPEEYRRIDGTCNNLQHPTRGAGRTPFLRFLPAAYSEGYKHRLAHDGGHLPLARPIRTELLAEGRVPDQSFTTNLANYLVMTAADVTDAHDTISYNLWKPYCCKPEGKLDSMCAPNKIPEDDPVHRYSGIRCMNMTRPITFQSSGCLPNDTIPERLGTTTVSLDLSVVYGVNSEKLKEKGRLFNGGLLKYEEDDQGRTWPPSVKGSVTICLLNKPHETRCHDSPSESLNGLLGINLIGIWYWRNHNIIAKELAKLNPHWNDYRLFNEARNINIATYVQILYYELLPHFIGYENMVKSGIISSKRGFRNLYNQNIIPKTSLEYLAAMRWVHTIQEGTLKLFDNKGNEYDEVRIVDIVSEVLTERKSKIGTLQECKKTV